MAGKRLFSVEAHGPGISFFGDPEEGGTIFADGKIEPAREMNVEEGAHTNDQPASYGLYDVNDHMVESFKSGVEPETGFRDALKTMELVDAVLQSQI